MDEYKINIENLYGLVRLCGVLKNSEPPAGTRNNAAHVRKISLQNSMFLMSDVELFSEPGSPNPQVNAGYNMHI